jgi:tetratricopeptide (TPR) repeat protein
MGLSTAFPAKQEYDSLKKLISVAPIETKINAMTTLAAQYEKDKDLVNAEKILNEAVLYIHEQRVATSETKKLEIQVMLQQARLALFSQADYNKSLAIFLKVLSRAKTINDIPSMMQTNLYLGFNYRFLNRYRESMQFLDQAISLATLLKDTGKMVTAEEESRCHRCPSVSW